MKTTSPPNTALIVTALRVEFQAVTVHLTDLRETTNKGSIYGTGTLAANGRVWEVTVVEAGAGNTSAAFETERAIAHVRPDLVIFVGIAGGLKDVAIGDVVVADRIYGYEHGKAEEAFKARPRGGQVSYALLQRAKAEGRACDWKDRLKGAPAGEPGLFVGPIAAGEKVLASSTASLRKFLNDHYNDALAIEMEGLGFLEAAHANRATFIVVRGISDLLDNKSNTDKGGSQQLAARNAAAFAIHLIVQFDPKSDLGLRPPSAVDASAYPWLTPWVGRVEKMEELRQALRTHKLVTVHGMGGVGKTRLAVETIRAYESELSGEAVFIPLEHCRNRNEELLAAIRDAVGATEVDAPNFSELRRFLSSGDRLLVLDNFETVMGEVGEVVHLAAGDGVRVLVTSQVVLGVTGEKVVALDPMLIEGPLEELESYRLFVALARLREANWKAESGEVVRDILRFTDGLPYLIEIVAARAPLQPLRKMAEGLRVKLRAIEARQDVSRPARHSSRQACLEWTFEHLPDRERVALPRLSIFSGGFDEEAARVVCSASVEALDGLIDSSLLRIDTHLGRYSMFMSTRDFARDILGKEIDRLAAAHAEWYIEWLCRGAVSQEVVQSAVRRWILYEIENIRQAIDWAESSNVLLFRKGVFALSKYLIQKCDLAQAIRLNSALIGRLDVRKSTTDWATAQNNLGAAYTKLPTGDRSENLGRAIACHAAVLDVCAGGEYPIERVTALIGLGNAYAQLPTEGQGEPLADAIEYYEAALSVAATYKSHEQWVAAKIGLGNVYSDLPTGDRDKNLLLAIEHYADGMRVASENDLVEAWAATQINLGNAYRSLPTGERGENLRRAIDALETVLRVFTELEFPGQWAMTQINLGDAIADLPWDRNENQQRAIACYKSALRVFTEHGFPSEWAMTCNKLGVQYQMLSNGDHAENLRQAISFHEAALRVYTEGKFPMDWAGTRYMLARLYIELPAGNRGKNLRRGIDCLEAIVRVFTEREFPTKWVEIKHNIGTAYSELPDGDRSANLKRSIVAFEAALRVWTESDFPTKWARIQQELGSAYLRLATENPSENLRSSIAAFRAALRVFTEHESPMEWAAVQHKLGRAYLELPTEDMSGLEEGAVCFESALRVFTKRESPMQWAIAQHGLGILHCRMGPGDEGKNLRRAVGCLEAALSVISERDFPEHWASAQQALAFCYKSLPSGNQADNLRSAIGFHKAALRVFTAGKFPTNWATTQKELGFCYAMLRDGNRGKNLKRAIACFEASLRVFTEREFPSGWAEAQFYIGQTYISLPTGDRQKHLKVAIERMEGVVRVLSESESPREWAAAHHNLGIAYSKLTGNAEHNTKRAIDCFEAAAAGFASAGLEEYAVDSREKARLLRFAEQE